LEGNGPLKGMRELAVRGGQAEGNDSRFSSEGRGRGQRKKIGSSPGALAIQRSQVQILGRAVEWE